MRTPFGTPPVPRAKEQSATGNNFDSLSRSRVTDGKSVLTPSASSNSLSNLGKSPSFDKLASGGTSFIGSGSLIHQTSGGFASSSGSFVEYPSLKSVNVKEAIAKRNAEIIDQTHRATKTKLTRTLTTSSKQKSSDSNSALNSQNQSNTSLTEASDAASITSTHQQQQQHQQPLATSINVVYNAMKFSAIPRPPPFDPKSSDQYRPRTVSADSYAVKSPGTPVSQKNTQ